MNAPKIGNDALETAVRLVLAMLPQQEVVQPDDITPACVAVDSMLAGMPSGSPGLEAIERAVQSRVVVWQEASKSLQDTRGHVEWLADAKASRDWPFWQRYRRFLSDVEGMPRQVIWRIDETTDEVLRKIEDPDREGSWDRRGLVVGEVQSGKTANYTGLICKAADAGYKLIVVLTGMHNSLRSQTQLRLDEGLLGMDTQYQQRSDVDDDERTSSSRIGVGALPGVPRLKIASLTTSAEKGDFRRPVAVNMNLPIGDYPVVLVIKKHRSIIDNVRKWVTEVEGHQTTEGSERVVPAGVPLLVIDDEADNASINTGSVANPESDPTKINGAIRQLLQSFDQSAYVGYTATPQANIYADSGTGHSRFGRDIFPSSFIDSLRAPSNYFGATRVFGLQSDDPSEPDTEPLPIFRPVQDYAGWLPDGHKKDAIPGDMPESLLRALRSFLLVCATRRVRGQVTKHNSMLIHATRFQDVQQRVADQIRDEVQFLRDRVRHDADRPSAAVWTELEQVWQDDFVKTTNKFPADGFTPVSWDEVRAQISPALEKILVKTVNGTSKDALDYYENRKQGLSVIAIGGNKLSRGLTLEGLSISYYLRTSKMYDTLLQMGRWFGYRPGYEDLCRLYSTPILQSAYREITAASEELRRDFDEMAVRGDTPEQYGLRVRSSVNGLLVTAPSKMRRAQKIKLSYSGDVNETSTFDVTPDTLKANWQTLGDLVTALDERSVPEPVAKSGSLLWQHIPPELIVEQFFGKYIADRRAQRVKPEFIAEYIKRCASVGELSNWSVLLVSTSAGKDATIAGHPVRLVERAPQVLTEDRYVIRRVLSPADESVDLSDEQRAAGLADLKEGLRSRYTAEGKLDALDKLKVPSGPYLRRHRNPDQPLLVLYPLRRPDPKHAFDVLGFAVSFPLSTQTIELNSEYVVNEVWLRAGFVDDEDDE